MSQEKIGKFIHELRKENKMTQQELAEKLGVTDRAIGNWENGRRMPDYSILKPLCEILNISVNELLNGERINKEEIEDKTEEVIINTLDYNKKKIKKIKLIFISLITIIVICILTLLCMFGIDMRRMRNNEQVVFGTWGFKYFPPINLNEENIERTIKEYLIKEDEKNNHYEDEKSFVAMKFYLIDEDDDETVVYAWILQEKYYKENENIIRDTASSIPHKITLKKNKDNYEFVKYENPRDGSYNKKDMKTLFPNSVLKQINKAHSDGTIEKLEFNIQEQLSLYYGK